MSTTLIRPLEPADWAAVRRIYGEGIATGMATFETTIPDWSAWDASHLSAGRRVALAAGEVAGWAALSPVSDRCAYGGVAEVSVYVGEAFRGRGIGSALLEALVEASEAAGIWTLQAGIFVENTGSIELHRRAGFRQVGVRERLGQLDGRWRDVALLERRSPRVGAPPASPEPSRYRLVRPRSRDAGRGTDMSTPEAVVTAVYDLLSGPAERDTPRDWDRFRDLVLPTARFLIARWPAGDELREDLREWDAEGFIADAMMAFAGDGFWEREIGGRTERFGSVAHRISAYESRVGDPDSDPVSRGVNSFQLVRYGGRWWVAGIVWDLESTDQPIPADLT